MHYDAIIIGAGMSGLAAGIRLAMFNKKVCILEQHFLPGGLNSYYSRGKYKFDVGLHAMTNFCAPGTKGAPLTKLLKQLRIPYSSFSLNQQKGSKVLFKGAELNFSNDHQFLKTEIEKKFPTQIIGYNQLLEKILSTNETALSGEYQSAKEVVASYIDDPLLVEMIFCPLLIYGSAWENDMDFPQFVIMFKSIFLEGFCRPQGGVRTIIELLINKFKDLGGELRYRTKVQEIMEQDGKAIGVKIQDGSEIQCSSVISSAGLPETLSLVENTSEPPTGKLTFTETILLFDKKPEIDSTIIFYNDDHAYHYRRPTSLFDSTSAVICFPNNFEIDDYEYGIIRLTHIANFDLWKKLSPEEYISSKKAIEENALAIIKKVIPNFNQTPIFTDTFTPLTIKKYTGHFGGTVYGSPIKSKDGTTSLENLYICGTDQGFLGIVGSILSGISMANLHGLMK